MTLHHLDNGWLAPPVIEPGMCTSRMPPIVNALIAPSSSSSHCTAPPLRSDPSRPERMAAACRCSKHRDGLPYEARLWFKHPCASAPAALTASRAMATPKQCVAPHAGAASPLLLLQVPPDQPQNRTLNSSLLLRKLVHHNK